MTRITKRVAVLLFLPALAIGGCEKHNKSEAPHEKAVQATQENAAEGGGRQRLRAVCADDIQKYCASADKKRRCLKDNVDKLSEPCKAALAQRHGRKARDNGGGDE